MASINRPIVFLHSLLVPLVRWLPSPAAIRPEH
ncbi:hypothetical protein EE612_051262 [Oryza sativa]|nr:hypothetical protein EE612_051262 [Oryza sativa]